MTRTLQEGLPGGLSHEELHVTRGSRTGLPIAIGVHSTGRGAAIGGCRIKHYPDWRSGVEDVLRLSEAMTLKCALADLPHGGGKTVAMVPEGFLRPEQRADLISDIADRVGALSGRYITGPDIGSTPEDMAVIYERTGGSAFCRPERLGGSSNSSTATAQGVLAAFDAGVREVFHTDTPTGLRVGIIGVGSVGRLIGELLLAAGAEVIVSDLNPAQQVQAQRLGFAWTTADLLSERIDVLVPAATGGLLSASSVRACQARLIVGPANNQLAEDSVAETLHLSNIAWVPDVIASAGGIIHAVCREELGLTDAETDLRIEAIGQKVTHILRESRAHDISSLDAARRLADDLGPVRVGVGS